MDLQADPKMSKSTFPKSVDHPMTVADLVARHPVRSVSISGNNNATIASIGNPENADAGSIIFIDGEGPAAESRAGRTRAGIIVRKGDGAVPPGSCHIRSDDPRAWF